MSGPAERLCLPIMLLRRCAVAVALALVGLCSLMSAVPAEAVTITVTSAGSDAVNDGKCTLVEALSNANSNTLGFADCAAGEAAPTVDTVIFNIPTTECPNDVCTIKPTTVYFITDSVTINGYTQPGASPNTLAVGDNAVL